MYQVINKVYSSTEIDELVLSYFIDGDGYNKVLQTHVKDDYIKHDYFIGMNKRELSDGEYFDALKKVFNRLGYNIIELVYTINEFNEVCYIITQTKVINEKNSNVKKRLVK